MTNEIVSKFDQLKTWSRGDQRAPHKPLLVLYALGRWQNGEKQVSFREVEKDLTPLLQEFGPPRRSDHPEQPFWRLQNDDVWTVDAPVDMPRKAGQDIPTITALRKNDVKAGFSDEVEAALVADQKLVSVIGSRLLDQHFPVSLHPDILSAVGLTIGELEIVGKKRDPKFRQRVLTAYEWRCAVCGLDVRLGTVSIALDASHIRWHQHGGPSEESNGLALCVLHHKTFDLGAFTLDGEGRLLVSDQANGSTGFHDALMRHHGQTVRGPQRPEWKPSATHLEWHAREVFKGVARHFEAKSAK